MNLALVIWTFNDIVAAGVFSLLILYIAWLVVCEWTNDAID